MPGGATLAGGTGVADMVDQLQQMFPGAVVDVGTDPPTRAAGAAPHLACLAHRRRARPAA